MNISFRQIIKKDIPLLVKLDKQAFNRDFDNAFTEAEFKELIDKNASCFLVYQKDTPIGFYIYENLNRFETEIVGIGIIPKHQRKGMGTYILQKILKEICSKKIKVVTHPKNTGALILYLKNGFVVHQYKKDYYGPNQPRLILYKQNNL